MGVLQRYPWRGPDGVKMSPAQVRTYEALGATHLTTATQNLYRAQPPAAVIKVACSDWANAGDGPILREAQARTYAAAIELGEQRTATAVQHAMAHPVIGPLIQAAVQCQ